MFQVAPPDVAKAIGISWAMVSDFECGARVPSLGQLAALAKALGVNPAWISYGEGELGLKPLTSRLWGMEEELRSLHVPFSGACFSILRRIPANKLLWDPDLNDETCAADPVKAEGWRDRFH